ncbi:MAG: 30S ribosomal protein S21 [Planctomycetota bacterium]
MGVRVEVGEGESLHDALRRLRGHVQHHCRRAWYKTRVGYYEKPSVRKRRKKRLQQRNRFLFKMHGASIRMYHGLRSLHSRVGGFPRP